MRIRMLLVIAALAAMVGAPASALPAAAASPPVPADFTVAQSASCTVNMGGHCTAGFLRANASYHRIGWAVNSGRCGADWGIYDERNGREVGSGSVRNGTRSGTINGLYGTYYMIVTILCGRSTGTINND
jgi:hypothetical protein